MSNKDNWRQIITKAWADKAFHDRLLAKPNEVLAEYHITIPDGVTFVVVEDELKGKRYLVLPPEPSPAGDLHVDDFGRNSGSGDPGF